ncbi:hypothetical protein [Colwellia sp. E2M01]|uniref:hypothetical protein n=1 Tax=Colwellia sp. E2M01 TaxID=2841561 RepID=UPI001C07FF72|nr:hypothetical protein [Colwellia sp. E2M01]MBU2869195.1 hypothetical protein [Colwellia sp. E2M01]
MKKLVHSVLALSVGMALTACGGSSSSSSNPTPTPVSVAVDGSAIKGTMSSAAVSVYNAQDYGSDTAQPRVSGIQTAADGTYSLQLTDEDGNRISGGLIIEIAADDDTTMICDSTKCGEINYGGTIPATQLAGLVLTTFTYVDSSASTTLENVKANALTSMATNALLASAESNDNVDLNNLTSESATNLQIASSGIVGSIIGVEIDDVNLFNSDIVDASQPEDVSTTDEDAATLTLINASFSSLGDGTTTLAQSMQSYFSATQTIVSAVIEDENVDLSSDFSTELTEIANVQQVISTESKALQGVVEDGANDTIPAKDVPATVDAEDIKDGIEAVENGTGGTGGTGAA